MEFRDDCAQKSRVGGIYRARDFFDKLRPNVAVFVAQRKPVENRRIGGIGNVHIIGHAAPRRFDRIAELV
jgi:hypothetical protein